MPHSSHSVINTVYVRQLLVLVHDGCLWLGGPIPVTDMLVHRITLFHYQGVNPANAFVGKSREKKMIDEMKSYFRLVKNSRGYTIRPISDGIV